MTSETSDDKPKSGKDVGPLFLANFVHQVVNPLNGVIGTLDNINDGTYRGDVVSQKINACRAQLEQCVSLIRNLAYLSDYFFEVSAKDALRPTIESGRSVLPQVIIEAIQFFQVAADKKHLRLELDDPKTQYKVYLRPELLRQVFMNLCDNWLKYGQSNQTITISPAVNSKNELVVEVSGRSIGFKGTEADRIFELGYRAESATAKVAQGSGIGLYICKEIIENNLGGKISASHNKSAEETTFRIAIPEGKWSL